MWKTATGKTLKSDAAKPNKRVLLIIILGALCLGAVFMATTLFLASCSASVASTIKADGGAQIKVQAEIPTVLGAKFRKLEAAGSSSAAQAPSFDAAAIRRAIAARPGLDLVALTQPNSDSIRVELSARSLADLAASPDFKGSSLITISREPTWTECRIRLERGGAKALSALFPGIDPKLLDALSPPALEEDPVSLAEYRTMLKSVLGDKAMPAMEAAAVSLSLVAPGPVLDSGGGSLVGSTLTATIPVIEILALEKPIEIWLRWKNPN